jgi:hypothetical protein
VILNILAEPNAKDDYWVPKVLLILRHEIHSLSFHSNVSMLQTAEPFSVYVILDIFSEALTIAKYEHRVPTRLAWTS